LNSINFHNDETLANSIKQKQPSKAKQREGKRRNKEIAILMLNIIIIIIGFILFFIYYLFLLLLFGLAGCCS